MKTASVRQLNNQTYELLLRSANEDILITSPGRPVACLVCILPRDIAYSLELPATATANKNASSPPCWLASGS